MTWNYTEKTTELFMQAVHGKQGTHLGEIENPDGYGEHVSNACGDALRFTFRVERDPEDPRLDRITEARYLTFGCTSAIAASEALCSLIEDGGRHDARLDVAGRFDHVPLHGVAVDDHHRQHQHVQQQRPGQPAAHVTVHPAADRPRN